MNFQNVSSHKVCFSCGSIASRKWCGACKMTEYCRESGTLTVYHVGVHKCHLKKDTKIYKKTGKGSHAAKQRFGCLRYSAGQGGPSSCQWQYLGSIEKSHPTLICKHKVGEGKDCLGKEPRKTLPGSSWYTKTSHR